jgi:ribosomal protein eS8
MGSSFSFVHAHLTDVTVLCVAINHRWVLFLQSPSARLQLFALLGISRTSRHKRSASGAQRAHYRKKRKFELGRQAANTKLGPKRVHSVRVRGGNIKYRALRLEAGNFAWGSEHVTKKTRIISVVSRLDINLQNLL